MVVKFYQKTLAKNKVGAYVAKTPPLNCNVSPHYTKHPWKEHNTWAKKDSPTERTKRLVTSRPWKTVSRSLPTERTKRWVTMTPRAIERQTALIGRSAMGTCWWLCFVSTMATRFSWTEATPWPKRRVLKWHLVIITRIWKVSLDAPLNSSSRLTN